MHMITKPSLVLDLLHKSLLAFDTPLTKVNKTVLLQEVYYRLIKSYLLLSRC